MRILYSLSLALLRVPLSSLTPHSRSASHDELPLPDARFFEFAEQMRQGLQKSEKKYRSRSWPASFHGSDAITWVQKALNLTSRDMASKIATEIMERVRIHRHSTSTSPVIGTRFRQTLCALDSP